ncbi:hypothetical protein N0K71_03755 [Dellaglioa algida]|nr:hypothetical protein [Dellaglioa algida]MDK1732733.1 hypothetical protein [Dellaglioa algida]
MDIYEEHVFAAVISSSTDNSNPNKDHFLPIIDIQFTNNFSLS